MLTVFNCGQGDAMRLIFPNCCWNKVPLYIDLGPSSFKQTIVEGEIDLLLTHCHEDHTMGFSNISSVRIRDLYLPAYLPEYCKIMIKLAHRYPKLPIPISRKAILIYEGMNFPGCKHIQVHNPPLDPRVIFEVSEFDESLVSAFLRRYDTSIGDIIQSPSGFDFGMDFPGEYNAELFVKIAIQKMATNRIIDGVDPVTQFIKHDSNTFSAVFSYCDGKNGRYLLTGDATKPVFKRLMQKTVDLRSRLLKVPHHGSKHSLDSSIIAYINPDCAIISHDNGLFGRSTDPHPNRSVIDDLKTHNVQCYYTNDVKKRNLLFAKAYQGKIPGFQAEIK